MLKQRECILHSDFEYTVLIHLLVNCVMRPRILINPIKAARVNLIIKCTLVVV
jgi:hypothetical protein